MAPITRVSSFFLKFMQHIEIIDFFKTQHFILWPLQPRTALLRCKLKN